MATTMRVKKGDTVHVIAGKDRGKQGRVLEARPSEGRVIVENLNVVKRHTKPRPMKDANRMGGTTIHPGRRDRQGGADSRVERHGRLPGLQPAHAGGDDVQGHQGQAREAARVPPGRLRAGDRRRRAQVTEKNGYAPRLKVLYEQELRGRLKDELGVSTVMQVPRVEKITLNMGVGEAKTEAKLLDAAMDELTQIAGQRAQLRRARTSIAGFKIRTGMPVGTKVTLRGARMYEFLDRLVSIALPAHPRLPRAQPALVRRPWELLHRPARADHLSRDRLRRRRADPRARRDDHDHGEDRRRGARAPRRPRSSVRTRRRRVLVAKKSMIAKASRTPKHPTQVHRRCNRCGRPRAVYRKFGLCRICLRELAHQGVIPGMTKASW